MIKQQLFAIRPDANAPRQYPSVLGYTKDEALAHAIVSDKRFAKFTDGYYNPDEAIAQNVSPAEVVIFESVDDLFEQDDEKARQRALAKLDPRERKLLGLE